MFIYLFHSFMALSVVFQVFFAAHYRNLLKILHSSFRWKLTVLVSLVFVGVGTIMVVHSRSLALTNPNTDRHHLRSPHTRTKVRGFPRRNRRLWRRVKRVVTHLADVLSSLSAAACNFFTRIQNVLVPDFGCQLNRCTCMCAPPYFFHVKKQVKENWTPPSNLN